MPRRFNRRQRSALYVAADGRCEECGAVLSPGWHADHIQPWIAKGETDVTNGQALCPKCNEKKGDRMPDNIELRPWQSAGEAATKQLIAYLKDMSAKQKRPTIIEKALVFWLDPGMGKSLLYMHCLNYLFRIGFIEKAGIYTPRINLCTQAELDWKSKFRPLYQDPVMGFISHSKNGSGMITEVNQFGFISTYQSLIAERTPPAQTPFEEHAAIFERYDCALVVDEAQLLGYHGLTQERNRSTEYIEMLAARASIIFVLTGTPLRADGKRLSMARYTDPDQDNLIYLDPAVRASYLDGVKHGSLRPFEFELFNGRAIHLYLDGEQEQLELTSMKHGLAKVLASRGWWSGAVDKTIEKTRAAQQIYPPYCGLIACATQDQAREVMAYLKETHSSVRALLAVSDETLAKDNLRQFKLGGYDILVTVQMAHIGYDHKPITVICCLTNIREEGWLRQLFGRGWRWDKDGPVDQQVFVIAPDDPQMQKIVVQLRQESQEGLLEKEPMRGVDPPPPTQPRLGVTISSELTDGRAVGMDESTDVTREEYPGLLEAAKANKLRAVGLTNLKGFAQALGRSLTNQSVPQRSPTHAPSMLTDNEIRAVMRTEINERARAIDRIAKEKGIAEEEDKNFTYREMLKKFNGVRIDDKLSKPELQKRIDWLHGFWEPYIKGRKSI